MGQADGWTPSVDPGLLDIMIKDSPSRSFSRMSLIKDRLLLMNFCG
jgi:hypothetical protein